MKTDLSSRPRRSLLHAACILALAAGPGLATALAPQPGATGELHPSANETHFPGANGELSPRATDTLFFSRRLRMEGDTDLGLLVKNTLDAVDWDTLKAKLLGRHA